MNNRELFEKKYSEFINWLIRQRHYITLALTAQCQVDMIDENDPVYADVMACIMIKPKSVPKILIHEFMVENGNQFDFNFIMMHELSHIPQVAAKHTAWEHAEYPDFIDTEERMKWAFSMVSNAAMDTALHENLRKLLGEDLQSRMTPLIQSFMQYRDAKTGQEPKPKSDDKKDDKLGCFAENIEGAERDKDFVYYASLLLKQMKLAGPGEKGIPMPGGGETKAEQGDGMGDKHDIDGDAETAHEAGKIVERAKAEGKAMANQYGHTAGDEDIFLGRGKISDRIKREISKIKVKAKRIAAGKEESKYDWNHLNKFWRNLPGRSKHIHKTAGVFFVADVSGSMCSPEILNQLLPAFEELKRKKIIAGAYAADTELKAFNRNVKGGGGTELEPRHAEELRKKHGLKPNELIDIVYITDGYVNLEQLYADKTVNLHVIIIDTNKH